MKMGGFEALFLPALYSKKPDSDYLIVVLHGKGDSMKPFLKFQEELGLKSFNFLLLNAPRCYSGGFSWYGEPPYQREGVLRIRERMFEVIKTLNERGWKSQQIFLLGFSQGCLVSADVALHYPQKLAGVIGVSGYFNFLPRWRASLAATASKTPWLLTHGLKDDILPIENTKLGVKKLRGIGLKIDWVEFEKKHTFEDEDNIAIRNWVRRRVALKYPHDADRQYSSI